MSKLHGRRMAEWSMVAIMREQGLPRPAPDTLKTKRSGRQGGACA